MSSDWPRDPALALPFSNLPLPLLCGGDESESSATAPSSSNDKEINRVSQISASQQHKDTCKWKCFDNKTDYSFKSEYC